MKIWLYKIKNKSNNKIYIGQTTIGIKRWKKHYSNAGEGKYALATAIRKYGKNNFIFKLLYAVFSKRIADYCEQGLIKKYNSIRKGYNRTTGGGTRIGTRRVFSIKHRKNLSKALQGNTNGKGGRTEKQKRNISRNHARY